MAMLETISTKLVSLDYSHPFINFMANIILCCLSHVSFEQRQTKEIMRHVSILTETGKPKIAELLKQVN